MVERPEIKFCGLTRPEDAALAAALGARYVGAIMAGGPRTRMPEEARLVLAAGASAQRVVVVRLAEPGVMAEAARTVGADILQLHADPELSLVRALRREWTGGIWAVVRMGTMGLPGDLSALFEECDAVVLDTAVPSGLGGSGIAFDWASAAAPLRQARGRGRLVLAGGLHSGNISDAMRALDPDVLDVSSGIEESPGVKSPDRMRAFARAVATLTPPSTE